MSKKGRRAPEQRGAPYRQRPDHSAKPAERRAPDPWTKLANSIGRDEPREPKDSPPQPGGGDIAPPGADAVPAPHRPLTLAEWRGWSRAERNFYRRGVVRTLAAYPPPPQDPVFALRPLGAGGGPYRVECLTGLPRYETDFVWRGADPVVRTLGEAIDHILGARRRRGGDYPARRRHNHRGAPIRRRREGEGQEGRAMNPAKE